MLSYHIKYSKYMSVVSLAMLILQNKKMQNWDSDHVIFPVSLTLKDLPVINFHNSDA